MPNGQGSIDEVIGQQAIQQVTDFTISLKKLTDEMTLALKAANELNSATGLKSVSAGVTAVNNSTKAAKEYTLTMAAQSVEQSRVRGEMKLTAKEISELGGAYSNLEATQRRLEKSARDAGIQFGINSEQFKKLSTSANAALNQLKAVDANLGNARRNVGNYGQAVFSLSQVFRELPAFAYSASTGVLALSNNLPILADSFSQVRKTTGSTIKAIGVFASSIFSFANILTLAIGVLTIWMARSEMAKNKTKELKETVDEFTQSVSHESATLMALKKAIEDTNLPMRKRISAINEIKEIFPDYFADLKTEALLNGESAVAYNLAAAAIEKKARANVALKEAEKTIAKIMKAEKELADFYKTNSDGALNPGTSPLAMEALGMQMKAIEAKEKQIALLKEELKVQLDINIANTDSFYTGSTNQAKSTKEQKEKKKLSPTFLSLKMMREDLNNIKGLSPEIIAEGKRIVDELTEYAKTHPIEIKWTKIEKLEAWAEQAEKILLEVQVYQQGLSQAAGDFADAAAMKELARLDAKEKKLKSFYDNEKRFIEQSGFSNTQKRKMEQKLDAETEAKRKQIDRDRVTALRKQAAIQKAADIASIITTTALAVVSALKEGDPYTKAARAALAGLIGAAQLAKAIATPLPQYARGRKGGKREWAVVGEKGQEAIVHNGRVELTPNAATVTLLPAGADVIPNHELIKNAAYVKLSKQGAVTTDKLQAALIESYERNTNELILIKQVLINKNYSLNNNDLSGYESYRKSKVH